jgi:Transposase IS116/IS110/IS902 family
VVDVPPKLSALTRVFTAGQGCKTDAHEIALAATRSKGLRPVTGDAQLEVLRVLADRRRALGEDHIRMVCQLHRLLADLIPGGAKKCLSAAQARALLARIRPRDPAGQARRRVAAELIADLERVYQRKKAADKELTAAARATGTTLMTLDGIGPSGAARLLVEIGDITRFPDRGHFASRTGPRRSTSPPATTSGTACPAPGTGRSTACQPRAAHHGRGPGSATPPKAAPPTTAKSPPGKPRWKRCPRSSAACPTWCSGGCMSLLLPPVSGAGPRAWPAGPALFLEVSAATTRCCRLC